MNAVTEATYRERIQRAVDYIEGNLTREVTLGEAAEEACWSAYHFMRTFQAVTGYTFGDYVRGRRMDIAAYRLVFTRDRILDIAMDVGYATQEAFTRAFKRTHGSSPGRYRGFADFKICTMPVDVDEAFRRVGHLPGGHDMNATIKEMGRLRIMGAELRTKAGEAGAAQISEFWLRYLQENTGSRIPGKIDPHVQYGLCTRSDEETGDYSYVIGYQVSDDTDAAEGFGIFEVPPRRYAVFSVRAPLADGEFTRQIQGTWKQVYGEWFPTSTEWQRGDGDDFELYDGRQMTDLQAACDICIPVVPRT